MEFWKSSVNTISVLSLEEQLRRLQVEFRKCEEKMATDPYTATGVFCNRTWDTILCWPDTPAGLIVKQPCPEYINMFDQGEFVTRHCTDNGTWWVHPDIHKPWSNYTACEKTSDTFVPQLIQEHMPRIKLMYTIGYSLSLTALILALIIMVYFKRLHCPRNIIHMNMFLAFGVRAVFSLMKTVLLVNDLGFVNDVNQTQMKVNFVAGVNHWECKLFFTLFYYIIFSSVMWIFNEGLYLQLILSISVFSDKTKVRWFVLIGWGIPLLFVIPWVICRIYLDDMLCWNVHLYRGLYWIIHGPMVASVAINFVIFVNTVRMLFTKLRAANCSESKMHRYRKLAKSTLILIPLFAVYYTIFMLVPDDVHPNVDLLKNYVEMLFNSFQGFLVALLFCFLNHEVQSEIRTKWRRRSMQKLGSGSITMAHHSVFRRFSTQRKSLPQDQPGKTDNNDGCGRKLMKSFQATSEQKATLPSTHKPPITVYRNTHQTTHRESVPMDEVVQPLVVENPQQPIPECLDSMANRSFQEPAREPLVICNKNYETSGKSFVSYASSDKKSSSLDCVQNNIDSKYKICTGLPIKQHSMPQLFDRDSNKGNNNNPEDLDDN